MFRSSRSLLTGYTRPRYTYLDPLVIASSEVGVESPVERLTVYVEHSYSLLARVYWGIRNIQLNMVGGVYVVLRGTMVILWSSQFSTCRVT